MRNWKITVYDGYAVSEHEMVSKSGYYSIADIFAIIEANTDLKRQPPKYMSKESQNDSPAAPVEQPKTEICPHYKSAVENSLNIKGICDCDGKGRIGD